MPPKSCVINPATGRAVGVPGVTYNKLVKQGAFKKGSIAERKGKLKAKKAAAKKAAPKKTPEENDEEEFKRLTKSIKRLETKIEATSDEKIAMKLSKEKQGLLLLRLRLRKKIKKETGKYPKE
jgi:hypothetical protein